MDTAPEEGSTSSVTGRLSDEVASANPYQGARRRHSGRSSSLVAARFPRGVAAAVLVAAAVGIVVWAVVGDGAGEGGLGIAEAVILGVVEGISEWLPISSTGHLAVTQSLLGIDGDAATSYAIAIQSGAILAVVGLYRQRLTGIVNGALGRDPDGRRTGIAIVVACVPAVAVGLAFEEVIKESLYGPWPVVVAWFVGGVVILVVARHRRGLSPTTGVPLTTLDWRGGLVIGFAQILALCPGVSRSLVTILAATALGLAVPAAVEFSFLLGFVILGGATFYETLSGGSEMLESYGLLTPLIGVAVALVSSAVAMRWMVAYLNRRGLGLFGYYRIGIAVVVAGLLVTEVISAS